MGLMDKVIGIRTKLVAQLRVAVWLKSEWTEFRPRECGERDARSERACKAKRQKAATAPASPPTRRCVAYW